MEDQGPVAAFLEQAAELAVAVAEERMEVNEYVETMDALKAKVPSEHVEECELAIQLAGYKMDLEEVKTSEEIRQCYRIAAEAAHKAIAEVREASLT